MVSLTNQSVEDLLAKARKEREEKNVMPDAPVSNQPQVPVSKKKKAKKVDIVKRDDTVYLRDFPKNLLFIAKSEFPNATNQTDAVAAYVAVKSGVRDSLSDNVKQLVAEWDGDGTIEQVDIRIGHLEKSMIATVQALQELELGLSYFMTEYLGYRKGNTPLTPGAIEFTDDAVLEVMNRLRVQNKQFTEQERIKKGRPIR